MLYKSHSPAYGCESLSSAEAPSVEKWPKKKKEKEGGKGEIGKSGARGTTGRRNFASFLIPFQRCPRALNFRSPGPTRLILTIKEASLEESPREETASALFPLVYSKQRWLHYAALMPGNIMERPFFGTYTNNSLFHLYSSFSPKLKSTLLFLYYFKDSN